MVFRFVQLKTGDGERRLAAVDDSGRARRVMVAAHAL